MNAEEQLRDLLEVIDAWDWRGTGVDRSLAESTLDDIAGALSAGDFEAAAALAQTRLIFRGQPRPSEPETSSPEVSKPPPKAIEVRNQIVQLIVNMDKA